MKNRENCNDTKMEELIKYIRKTSLFRQVVPMEAASGWPIPSIKSGEVYVTLPFYGVSTQQKGKTLIYPPLCTITVKWSNKTIVDYKNLRYDNSWKEGNWEKAAGFFPHATISTITVKEYKNKKKELMELYDKLVEGLNNTTPFTSNDEERFKELISTLMEPSLLPYYKSLNSEFFSRYF